MATAQDVAAAIIDRIGPVDPMKLQKLLFFAQGWSLAWRGEPMFNENIEAWEFGPVVEGLYQTYKDYRYHDIDQARAGDPAALSPDESETLSAVLDRYGEMSGPALSQLTHENSAWDHAYSSRPNLASPRSRQVIDPHELARSLKRGPTAKGDRLGTEGEALLADLLGPLVK